jgi:predicted lipoprotein with Yx(FWY)xxD motif
MRILRRPAAMVSLVVISALLLAACQNVGSGSSAPSSGAGAPVTVTAAQTDAGDALSGEGGMTLYLLTTDTDTTSTCTGTCATNWPPLLGDGSQVTAGDGVSGTFGTITRDDGQQQVTHDGHPLYYFSGDSAAGQSNGEGAGGVWFIAPPGDGASAGQSAAGQGPSATPYRAPGY